MPQSADPTCGRRGRARIAVSALDALSCVAIASARALHERAPCLAEARSVYAGSNQSHCHGVIVSNGPANIAPRPGPRRGATRSRVERIVVEPAHRHGRSPAVHVARLTRLASRTSSNRPHRRRRARSRPASVSARLDDHVDAAVRRTAPPRATRARAARPRRRATRNGPVSCAWRCWWKRSRRCSSAPSSKNSSSVCVDRFGHEVAGDVVDGVELGLAHRARGAARGRRHPPLAVHDAGERELLGHVVELVPLVVRVVLGRVGDLGEREEPDLDLLAASALIRSGRRDGDRDPRRRAQLTLVVAHLDVPHQVVRPRWMRAASACTDPSLTGRRKLVLFDMPSGTLPSGITPSAVPIDASVSAIAAYTPP